MDPVFGASGARVVSVKLASELHAREEGDPDGRRDSRPDVLQPFSAQVRASGVVLTNSDAQPRRSALGPHVQLRDTVQRPRGHSDAYMAAEKRRGMRSASRAGRQAALERRLPSRRLVFPEAV